MCSQRSAECTRSLSGRSRFTGAGSGSSRTSRGLLATAVFNARSRDLLVALEIDRLWCCCESEVLLDQLIRSVLARRLDEQTIFALLHRTPRIVSAVPRDTVLARKTRRARDRRNEIGRTGALRRDPSTQLADVARPATTVVDPQRERAHRLAG